MKKIGIASLLLTVAFMTACGGANTSTKEAVAEVTETGKGTETEANEAETGEAEGTEEEKEAPVEKAEVPRDTTKDYVKGIINETEYESEWLGIRFVAPEGTILLTQEELDEMMGIGTEMLSGEVDELQLKYAEMTSVVEMMCKATGDVPNLIITVEKMINNLSVEEYISAFEQTLAQISSVKYTVESDAETVTIGGEEFHKIATITDMQGSIAKQDFFIRILGDRVIAFTLTYTEETADMAEDMMNAFSAY